MGARTGGLAQHHSNGAWMEARCRMPGVHRHCACAYGGCTNSYVGEDAWECCYLGCSECVAALRVRVEVRARVRVRVSFSVSARARVRVRVRVRVRGRGARLVDLGGGEVRCGENVPASGLGHRCSVWGGLWRAGGWLRRGWGRCLGGEKRHGPWLWQGWPRGAAAGEGGRRVNRLERTRRRARR